MDIDLARNNKKQATLNHKHEEQEENMAPKMKIKEFEFKPRSKKTEHKFTDYKVN